MTYPILEQENRGYSRHWDIPVYKWILSIYIMIVDVISLLIQWIQSNVKLSLILNRISQFLMKCFRISQNIEGYHRISQCLWYPCWCQQQPNDRWKCMLLWYIGRVTQQLKYWPEKLLNCFQFVCIASKNWYWSLTHASQWGSCHTWFSVGSPRTKVQ